MDIWKYVTANINKNMPGSENSTEIMHTDCKLAIFII